MEAEVKFGWEIDHYYINHAVECVNAVSGETLTPLWRSITASIRFCWKAGIRKNSALVMAAQAKIEIGLEIPGRRGLSRDCYPFRHAGRTAAASGWLSRADGKSYGFGGEGDWKTAAMVRLMKITAAGFRGKGNFFYGRLYIQSGSGKKKESCRHICEVCPSIAEGPISIKVQPLSMGNRGRSRPFGIHFQAGPAVDLPWSLGNHFRPLY